MNQRFTARFAAGAMILLFAAGIIQLFLLRFKQGDVYPPYSSLRSDPLGCRVLYESLAECPGVSVARNYGHVASLDLDPGTVLFYLGGPATYNPFPCSRCRSGCDDTAGRLSSFMRRGGRVVISFMPSQVDGTNWWTASRTARPVKKKEEKDKDKDEDETESDADGNCMLCRSVSARDWLKADVDHVPCPDSTSATLASRLQDSALPTAVSCHTTVVFTNACDEWQTVYDRDGRPVVIERTVGNGTLVLSALSYFVSNEAMRNERHPALLAWLVGKQVHAVFEESHFGIVRSRGIVALARSYNLHWLGVCVAVLVALFLWQSSYGLVPAPSAGPVPGQQAVAAGFDSLTGLVNLLRRNVSVRDMLEVCLDEWGKTGENTTGRVRARVELLRDIVDREQKLPAGKRDPVRGYNEICGVLNDGAQVAQDRTVRQEQERG